MFGHLAEVTQDRPARAGARGRAWPASGRRRPGRRGGGRAGPGRLGRPRRGPRGWRAATAGASSSALEVLEVDALALLDRRRMRIDIAAPRPKPWANHFSTSFGGGDVAISASRCAGRPWATAWDAARAPIEWATTACSGPRPGRGRPQRPDELRQRGPPAVASAMAGQVEQHRVQARGGQPRRRAPASAGHGRPNRAPAAPSGGRGRRRPGGTRRWNRSRSGQRSTRQPAGSAQAAGRPLRRHRREEQAQRGARAEARRELLDGLQHAAEAAHDRPPP